MIVGSGSGSKLLADWLDSGRGRRPAWPLVRRSSIVHGSQSAISKIVDISRGDKAVTSPISMPNRPADSVSPGLLDDRLDEFLPDQLRDLDNIQTAIPALAKDKSATKLIEDILGTIPTRHDLWLGDSRQFMLSEGSVHLVVTSPPYWTLKKYREIPGQLGHLEGYEEFLGELDRVWEQCFDALVPGGRLICVVGDVCLSRRKNNGRHTVVPLHASIQEHCRALGYDNLAPIIWHKIANAVYEVEGNSAFLGKPYEPNSVIKNDIEFILMERKPGGYRTPSTAKRLLSIVPAEKHRVWFQQIWSGLTGASTRRHPAPYPAELATRLIRMFSFVGDTVLDPFSGTGTTSLAAMQTGRNSIGCEIDPTYMEQAWRRLSDSCGLFSQCEIVRHEGS